MELNVGTVACVWIMDPLTTLVTVRLIYTVTDVKVTKKTYRYFSYTVILVRKE